MTLLRRSAAIVAAAGLALTLAACGGSSQAADTVGTAAADDVATRVVDSPFTGEQVEIPTHPQRVLALWRTGSELADIGVVPVGTLDGEFTADELDPETYASVKDVPIVGSYEGVDIEKVIALEPDLIVGMDHGGLGIDYTELSEIAPTVILQIAEPTDVWDNYPALADLVGKSTDYDTLNAAVDDALATIKAEHGDRLGGLSTVALNATEGTIWVSTSKSLAYRRLDAAGFGYEPTYTTDPERYVTELAAENLPDLAGQDAIFYQVNRDGSVPADLQAILDSESFQRLPAVEAGHLFPLTSAVNYTFEAAQKGVEDLRAAAESLAGAK